MIWESLDVRKAGAVQQVNKKPSPTLIALLLVIITLAVFWRVFGLGFVYADDGDYITGNHHVQMGFTAASIRWAFTSGQFANWHPLTWISHMLDVRLFDLRPAGHHAVNLLFHLINVVLLFLLLQKITGARWRSAFVAALFAIHPLHVESVAWVSERKDVLSTFFLFLTIWAYTAYSSRPSIKRILGVAGLFAMGLMAKPSLVTLPFALLLLDYWPLRRKGGMRLVWEKWPLFALSAASAIVTYIVQARIGAVASEYPIGIRIANAVVAYVSYISKMFWPVNLAFPYPHPTNTLPTWEVIASGIILTLITILVIRSARRRPYIAMGWFWYLGMLVPMIGIIQVGGQAMADRYTYVPLIGLFIILSWGASEIWGWAWKKLGLRRIEWAAPAVGGLVLLPLMVVAWIQVGYWKDSKTLAGHALEVTSGNYLAHHGMGVTLALEGDNEGAIYHFSEALRLHLNQPEDHYFLAVCLSNEGSLDEAIVQYRAAIELRPEYPEAHYNLGVAWYYKGDFREAWEEVHLARQYGYTPAPAFLDLLRLSMPEPQ